MFHAKHLIKQFSYGPLWVSPFYGLEDFEAMALLEEPVDKARKAGRSVPAAQRALALAGELVTIPNAGGLRSTEILPDPERLPAARRAVNAALVQLLPRNISP